MSDWRTNRKLLLDFALGMPEAYEDHPWGESVVKVNKRVFIFLGVGEDDQWEPQISIKLREYHELAMAIQDAAPTGYGLGRAGWVSIPLKGDLPPLEVLFDWVEESYRIVAPKRLVKELDARAE